MPEMDEPGAPSSQEELAWLRIHDEAVMAALVDAAHDLEQAERENRALMVGLDNLRIALESRTEISQAVGMIMAASMMTPEEAFGVLARASQRANDKLVKIARAMVAAHIERVKALRASS